MQSNEQHSSKKQSKKSVEERLETRLLIETIKEKYGYDLSLCQEEALNSTLHSCTIRLKKRSLSALQEELIYDEKHLDPLLHDLFLPSSKETISSLRAMKGIKTHVMPYLRTYPTFKVWHMGCSESKTTVSLLKLFEEEKIAERAIFYATDISVADTEMTKKELGKQKNKTPKRVGFYPFNFLTDSSFNEFQFILVSTKVSALNDKAQNRVMGLLHDSISPLGFILFKENGLVEQSSYKNFYKAVDSQSGIYQRRV